MKWRSASSAGQFRLLNQTLTLDQVAEFRRTRRVKEGTGSSASVSAAFGPVGPIHPGNPDSMHFSTEFNCLAYLRPVSSAGAGGNYSERQGDSPLPRKHAVNAAGGLTLPAWRAVRSWRYA